MPDPAPEDATKPRLERPAQVKVPPARVLRELPVLVAAGPARALDIVRATAELAHARILLSRKTVRQLGIPDFGQSPSGFVPDDRQCQHISRVAKAIAIAAPRVPWRSDCLVQCLAGRRWLAARGIPSRISIGMKREAQQGQDSILLAHAWLSAGDVIVTGGDIADFARFGDQPPHT
ncbi:lasso peptide biosynthesis B2 protein [Novosphingobium sp. 17-62-19]|uniref:lasso peptide biosynthesis B2 protein n=1 Tax=Novosphingobium sp. 17-62-19 TaxID=1970406 RepID=UPI0025F663A1|nr:lasso peptide biosynthesis B2 protein [Novosphingobium sp. 17-62-19]HQS95374.1 lasso peptide biosynthesis B2 protein [Novosphingobium sp.]